METSKKTKNIFKFNAFISALAIFGIILTANLISEKMFFRIDFSADKRFTLSDESLKTLETLSDKIEIGAFFKKTSKDYSRIKEILETYNVASQNISYTFVDPDREPVLAKKFNNFNYNLIIVFDKTRNIKERVFSISEENITNAIIKLTKRDKKAIYFIKGHGEKSILERDSQGLYELYNLLLNKGYKVEELYIPDTNKIPDDASVIVIAGAKFAFLKKEMTLLKNYIKSGGSALFMVDPSPSYSFNNELHDFGFHVSDNIIYDSSSKLIGSEPTVFLLNTYGKMSFMDKMKESTVFSGARQISLLFMLPEKIDADIIAKSGKYSFGETDLSQTGNFDAGKDIPGPLGIAASSMTHIDSKDKKTNKNYRVTVIGDSDFCSNKWLNSYGNKTFIMNIISWLAEENNFISLEKNSTSSHIFLETFQLRNIFYLCVIIIPLLTFLIGIFIILKRRSTG